MSKAKKILYGKSLSSNPYEGREGVVYIRVSSKRQEIEGSGLESQEGRCLKELKLLNINHSRTFPDSFTGGGDFMKRPAMRDLLAYVDANPHKKFLVIFDDLKRFARDTKFHFELRTAFRGRDILPKCLNYNFDDSPEGMFFETILAAGNELERHQNRRQVIQKQKSRLELGYWAFGSKKGYVMTKTPEHGNICIANKEGLDMLRPALEGFAKGVFVHKVDACRFLVEKGFWHQQSPEKYIDKMVCILKDPFYAGYIEYPVWEVSRRLGKHKGLISVETFDLIQKRLKKEDSGQRVRVDMSSDFPMRGLLLCDDCGRHITGAWSTGRIKKYPYYFCQNKACISYQKSIRKQDIENRFDNLLKYGGLKGDISSFVNTFDKIWNEEVSNYKHSEDASVGQKKVLEEKITELTDLMINTNIDLLKKTYEKQIEKTAKELESIEQNSLKGLDLSLPSIPYRTTFNKATTMLKNPYTIWKDLDVHEQHKLFYFISEEKLSYNIKEGYRTIKTLSMPALFEGFLENPLDVEMLEIESRCKSCSL